MLSLRPIGTSNLLIMSNLHTIHDPVTPSIPDALTGKGSSLSHGVRGMSHKPTRVQYGDGHMSI